MSVPALTRDMLDRHWPDGDDAMIDGIVATQGEVLDKYAINTPRRLAHFMGQVTVECQDGTRFSENLSYRNAWRLMRVYETHFPTLASAEPYLGQPQKLADLVYGGRYGNVPGTDDGWRYRGRGLIQVTFRSNYQGLGLLTGLDLVDNPDLALDPAHALMVAGAFWARAGCNGSADGDSVIQVTKRINGGLNALQDRVAATNAWRGEFGS